MLSVEEALEQIIGQFEPTTSESVDLASVLGRNLALSVKAQRSLPPFANSAMDGYALRSSDTVSATSDRPVRLRVAMTVQAGAWPEESISEKTCARIFTGAPVPSGADAVVMQEDVVLEGNELIVRKPVLFAQHIRPVGDDVQQGQIVAKQHQWIGPGEIAMFAAQGISWVQVFRRPRVVIVSTGDELVEIDARIDGAKIANSNAYMLAAQVQRAGGIATRSAIVRDDVSELKRAFMAATSGHDVILTTGGVSVGDFDLVRNVLQQIGQLDFWQVAMKPGKPLAFGRIGNTPIFGLPGNPVSAFVCFELFVRPALQKMAGFVSPLWNRRRAQLTDDVKTGRRREFLRGQLLWRDQRLAIAPISKQGSGQHASLLRCDALLDVPIGSAPLKAGAEIDIIALTA